jgi:hypothetical protein
MTRKSFSQFFYLLLFIFSYNFCSPQNISIGIKGGISIPNLQASGSNPVSKGWSSRLGPYAGAIAELNITKQFSLQAELNYSSQGGKKNGTQAIPTSDFAQYLPDTIAIPPYVYAKYKGDVILNYIELPVIAKINFPISSMISFFVNAGPYAGYLVKAKTVTSGSSKIYFDENLSQSIPLFPDPISFDQNADIKSELKKFNFGIQGGIGFNFKISDNSKIMITAGGNYGLIKLQKDKANGENNTGAATLTVGYLAAL